jgi:signal transduction histidine kinase
MKIKNFLLILIFVSGSAAYAQKKLNKDTAIVNALNEETKTVIGSDSAKAINLARQAKEIAHEINYSKGEAMALKNLGMVNYLQGKYVETLDYWNESLRIFENIKDDIGVSNMLNNIGAIYLNEGADAKALEYMLRSLKLAETIGDTLRIITALCNVGSIYYNKKDSVALNYFLRAIPMVERSGHVGEYVVITGNIGEVYADKNDNQKALEYFRKSIKAAGDNFLSAFSVNGIGKVYRQEGKLSEALKLHNEALENAKKFGEQLEAVRSLKGIADVHLKLNNLDLAIEYYKKAKVAAEGMDNLTVELEEIYKNMASIYSRKKDFQNAFLYQSRYSDIKGARYDIEIKKKLNQLQFDFELSRKEAEIAVQEARIKAEKQARIGILIGSGLLMACLTIFSLYRIRINQIRKEHKIRSKLASDLHDDLGGTLNSVKIFANLALMEDGKEKHLQRIKQSTQEAISALKDIIWIMNDKKDTVEDLVSRISHFVVPLFESTAIQYKQEISRDSLAYHLGSEEKRNLYMIVKEAVNNSVKHSGADDLSLAISLTNGKPTIIVRDNGKGFDNIDSYEGNGLKNIKMRASQIHYHLSIKSVDGTIIHLQKL